MEKAIVQHHDDDDGARMCCKSNGVLIQTSLISSHLQAIALDLNVIVQSNTSWYV